MSVQRGYYQVPSKKLGNAASNASNFGHRPLTAVYTNSTRTSSGPRVANTKHIQPKIMSPATHNSTQRRNYVTTMSIVPKEKIPKVVVLPSIDKDIAVPSGRSGSVSTKVPVVKTVAKPIREAPESAKASNSQTKYVSCLHTSLSTEWKKDSFDKETACEAEKEQMTSSLKIECNNKTSRTTASATSLLSRVADKADSKEVLHRSAANKKFSSNRRNCKENTDMDKQIVRIQYLPSSATSFTIKDATVVTDAKRVVSPSTNVTSSRGQDFNSRQGLRPRMLPKSRFRVKIQKCHHKSVNISDSFNCTEEKRVKTLGAPSRSVVIQDKSTQRSFSVQKHTF